MPGRPGRLDQLDVNHLGRVGATRTELEDARVAARTLAVPGADLLEQLVDGELVLVQRGQRLAPGVEVTTLGERDQLLDLRLDDLRLRLRGLIRSWSTISVQRLSISALRCPGLGRACSSSCGGASFRSGRRGSLALRSVVSKAKAPDAQGLLDLLDALAPEVRDRAQLALGLLHQVTDRLDARPLEAVVGAHPELELLDQDLLHAVRRGRRTRPPPARRRRRPEC